MRDAGKFVNQHTFDNVIGTDTMRPSQFNLKSKLIRE